MIKKFLLADDDEDDTNLFDEALRKINSTIEFFSARNGKDMLDKLNAGKVEPQVIFLDINMPEMNGWEALEKIKKTSTLKDIPVIMYSTSSSARDGKKAVESGALGFYEKPASFLKLKDFLALISASTVTELASTMREISASKEHKVYSG